MAYDYDLVVIGVGPAGEKGAVQAAYYGKRVACIEAAREPGGAAVHTGTLPSKTLRETALFLSGFRQRELYGLSVDLNPAAAVPKLLSRKNTVVELEVARIRWNLERHRVPILRGTARFVDAHAVELMNGPATSGANADLSPLSPRRVTSEVFLVATGSRPHHPPDIPFDDEDVDDSDSILQIDRLPKSLVVVGGGVIGCEYAAMFAAMRVQVTLIEGRPRLLQFLDEEIAERLRGAMQALGVTFHLGRTTKSVRRVEARGIVTTLDSGLEIDAEKVLASSGRSGASEGLGLEALGVEVDKRGTIKVDADFCTAVPGIYAAGDVIGFPALASTSMEQARVAVCHAFGFAYKRQVSHLLPFGIYTIPEVGSVGFSEEGAKAAGREAVAGRAFYRDNARGKIVGDKDGIVKLVVERGTRKLLGCHCIGERATELVHIGQSIMQMDGTIDAFIEMVFNYPTLSEMFKYAAYDALNALARPDRLP
jgi:NAD(P) transhydrogenase